MVNAIIIHTIHYFLMNSTQCSVTLARDKCHGQQDTSVTSNRGTSVMGNRIQVSRATGYKCHGQLDTSVTSNRVQVSWATGYKYHGQQGTSVTGNRVQVSRATGYKCREQQDTSVTSNRIEVSRATRFRRLLQQSSETVVPKHFDLRARQKMYKYFGRQINK